MHRRRIRSGGWIAAAAWTALAATAAAEPDRRQINQVILEDVPAWDDGLRNALRPYMETRSASLFDLSDDGRSMLIATRFGQTAQLHLVAKRKGARQQLTFLDEPVRDGVFVPGSKRGDIIYSADTGGNENAQIYMLSRETGGRTLLTDGKSRHDSPLVSGGGRWLAYAGNARNGRDFDIYIRDLKADGPARLLHQVEGAYYPAAFSPTEDRLLVLHYVSARETRLFAVETDSGEATLVTTDTKPIFHGSAAWRRDGKALFVVSDRGGEFRKLHMLDLASGDWKTLTDDLNWDVDDVAVDPRGGAVVFTANEDGYSTLYVMDPETHDRRVIETPKGVISGLTFNEAGGWLGFTLDRSTHPADAYLVNMADLSLEDWTASEAGGLNTENLIEPTLIRYPTFDQVDGRPREIPAFYYRPPGAGPHPVVIVAHGGPESQFRPNFSPRIQSWVNELGVAILAPNVRGSTGYGRTFHQLDNGVLREDSVRDIEGLLNWIARQPELDAKRVGIFGGSYGGYMVLGSLVNFPQRFKAGIDFVGITDFITFLENTSEYRRDLRREEYGDERDPEVRGVLERISPLRQADKIEAALFVIHGANDPRVPLSEAEQIVARMRERNRPVWFVNALNEGHGFRKKENVDLSTILFAHFWQRELIGR